MISASTLKLYVPGDKLKLTVFVLVELSPAARLSLGLCSNSEIKLLIKSLTSPSNVTFSKKSPLFSTSTTTLYFNPEVNIAGFSKISVPFSSSNLIPFILLLNPRSKPTS